MLESKEPQDDDISGLVAGDVHKVYGVGDEFVYLSADCKCWTKCRWRRDSVEPYTGQYGTTPTTDDPWTPWTTVGLGADSAAFIAFTPKGTYTFPPGYRHARWSDSAVKCQIQGSTDGKTWVKLETLFAPGTADEPHRFKIGDRVWCAPVGKVGAVMGYSGKWYYDIKFPHNTKDVFTITEECIEPETTDPLRVPVRKNGTRTEPPYVELWEGGRRAATFSSIRPLRWSGSVLQYLYSSEWYPAICWQTARGAALEWRVSRDAPGFAREGGN